MGAGINFSYSEFFTFLWNKKPYQVVPVTRRTTFIYEKGR